MRYALLAGGKRLRPVLCLAAAEAVEVPLDHALPAALALELVHAFSLVHDDLPALDDDALRRGQPATHVRFGEDVAILAGDALLNGAFALLAAPGPAPAARRLAALATVARAVGPAGMIGGQYLDLTSAGDIDEAGLRRVDRLKTGALFEAAVGCAVALADPPAERAAALEAYGAELGLLYQIVDDLLDATGTEEQLGKPAGGDVRAGRRTHVTVLGVEEARRLADGAHARAVAALAPLDGDGGTLQALVEIVASRDR
jgi:geranylgeranyl diphosphate synthase type II